jgi:hypothetical protein
LNKNELEVAKRYGAEGWRVIHGGAPDLLCIKVAESGGILDAEFVEVKSGRAGLTYEQKVYRKVLETLGAKYKVERISATPIQARPNQTHPSQANPIQPNPTRLIPGQAKEVLTRDA